MTPDEMMEKLRDQAFDTNDGVLVNDLLSEFWRGYPIENLKRLDTANTQGDMAFLVSELGKRARPLLREIVGLLKSDTPRVRGDAIDALSQCTTWENGEEVAKIVEGLADSHPGVRWTAGNALRYIESQTLEAGLEYLKSERPDSVYGGFRNAFLAIERRPEKAEDVLRRLLNHDDPVARRFGAAMCLRPRLVIDPERAALAESAADPEIVAIVQSATPMPFWAVWERST